MEVIKPAIATDSAKLPKTMPTGDGALRLATCTGTIGACKRASKAGSVALAALVTGLDDFNAVSSEPSEGLDLSMYMNSLYFSPFLPDLIGFGG